MAWNAGLCTSSPRAAGLGSGLGSARVVFRDHSEEGETERGEDAQARQREVFLHLLLAEAKGLAAELERFDERRDAAEEGSAG
jgi:hypothetical protein